MYMYCSICSRLPVLNNWFQKILDLLGQQTCVSCDTACTYDMCDAWCVSQICMICPLGSRQNTEEGRVFKHYYAELKQQVNPSDVVAHLYAKEVISDSERDDADNKMLSDGDRMSRLLPAVERAIRMDNKKFYTFLDVLEASDPKYKPLVKNMKDAFATGNM